MKCNKLNRHYDYVELYLYSISGKLNSSLTLQRLSLCDAPVGLSGPYVIY